MLDSNLMVQALQHTIEHHDALRLRFTKAEKGWQQSMTPLPDKVPFVYVDLSQVSAKEQQQWT